MEAIDFEIDKFFGEIASIHMDIMDYENWCRTYETFNYPDWTMKDGNTIKLSNMSDTHLDNTIKLVERKDPKNTWIKVLNQEKTYRKLKQEIKTLKTQLAEMEEISDKIF